MSAESALYRLTAVAPLIMHNARLVDPLDPWSREIAAIAGKRFKTLADHERLAKAEFFGSAWMADGRPCIPATVIEGVIVAAAKTRKRGRQARSGIICTAKPTQRAPTLRAGSPASPQDKIVLDRFDGQHCGARCAQPSWRGSPPTLLPKELVGVVEER
jgi:hypothetical protein